MTIRGWMRWDLTLGLTGIFLLAGCGGKHPSRDITAKIVPGVRLETVSLQSSPIMTEVAGTVQSVRTSVLSAQIGGTVREIRVRPGDHVRQGQVLALLDDRTPRAQLRMAEAGVAEASDGLDEVARALEAAQANRSFAHTTLERYRGLLAKNSISRQEFDEAQTRYQAALANEKAMEAKRRQVEARQQQARSQVSSAEALYSYSRVVSPLNGVVVAKAVDPGTVVMPGAPLLTVEDNSRYRLEVHVPGVFGRNVDLGQQWVASLSGGDFPARVAEIVPAADPASRTFLVKLDLPRDCKCRSGEYGRALAPVGAEESFSVPSAAVVNRGELEGVFVAGQDSIARFRLVKTGRTAQGRTGILSGLSAGERVAISNVDQLQDGVRLEEP